MLKVEFTQHELHTFVCFVTYVGQINSFLQSALSIFCVYVLKIGIS